MSYYVREIILMMTTMQTR